jgi:hypothetical protein
MIANVPLEQDSSGMTRVHSGRQPASQLSMICVASDISDAVLALAKTPDGETFTSRRNHRLTQIP